MTETLARLFTFTFIVRKVWTWANSPSVPRGRARARRATGITVFMMSSFSENKDGSHFDDTLRLKLTGNTSKASQLSPLKDKNQFWIHCDEQRVDAGVIVALPLYS